MASWMLLLPIGSSDAFTVGLGIGSFFWLTVIVLFFVGLLNFYKTRKGKWLATFLVTGFLLLITIGNLAVSMLQLGLTVSHVSKERESLVGGRTVKTLSGQLSFELPDMWKRLEGLNDYATLEIGSAEREEYLIVQEIMKEDFAGDIGVFEKLETDSLTSLASGAPLSEGKNRR